MSDQSFTNSSSGNGTFLSRHTLLLWMIHVSTIHFYIFTQPSSTHSHFLLPLSINKNPLLHHIHTILYRSLHRVIHTFYSHLIHTSFSHHLPSPHILNCIGHCTESYFLICHTYTQSQCILVFVERL